MNIARSVQYTITPKQVNRLFAIAWTRGLGRPHVAREIHKRYGTADPNALTWAQYDNFCTDLLARPAVPAAARQTTGG